MQKIECCSLFFRSIAQYYQLQNLLHHPICDAKDRPDNDPPSDAARQCERDDVRVHPQCDLVDEPEEDRIHEEIGDQTRDQVEWEGDEVEERPHEEIHECQEAADDDEGADSPEECDVLRQVGIQESNENRVQHDAEREPEREGEMEHFSCKVRRTESSGILGKIVPDVLQLFSKIGCGNHDLLLVLGHSTNRLDLEREVVLDPLDFLGEVLQLL